MAISDGKIPVNMEPTERRFCSVLFADIVQSTELIYDLDPEEAFEKTTPVIRLIMEVCESFGALTRNTGDGAIAFFGLPKADEDHVLKAVHAGLAVLKNLNELGSDRVDLRIGIHVGEVLVGTIHHSNVEELAVAGSTVHVAKRIEESARPNTVAISGAVQEVIGNLFNTIALGEKDLKGVKDATGIYEVTSRDKTVSRWDHRTSLGLSAFVGREDELARINAAWDLVRDGARSWIAIQGEAGVGKSRLVHEFLDQRLLGPHTTLDFTSSSLDRHVAFLPVINELGRILGINTRSSLSEATSILHDALETEFADDPMHCNALLSVFGLIVADQKWVELGSEKKASYVLSSLSSVLGKLSATSPLVVLFEDIHWSDQGTRQFLKYMLEHWRGNRALFLILSRDALAFGGGEVEKINLLPLDEKSTNRFLENILGDFAQSPTLEKIIKKFGDRTPLFIEELSLHFRKKGAIDRYVGLSDEKLELTSLQLPTSVQSLIAQRLDALSPEERKAVQLAAVIGNTLPLELFVAMLGDGAKDVDVLIGTLIDHGVLHRQNDKTCRFKHALIQQVAYNGMPRMRRRRIHRDVVEAIGQLDPGRDPGLLQTLAIHAELGEQWMTAARGYLDSGNIAIDRAAFDSAIYNFNSALSCLAKEKESETAARLGIEIRRRKRVAMVPSADFRRILDVAEEIEELSLQVGDHSSRMHAMVDRTILLTVLSGTDEAIRAGHDALEQSNSADDGLHSAYAAFGLGQAYWFAGDFQRAVVITGRYRDLFLKEFRGASPSTNGSVSVLGLATRANALVALDEIRLAEEEIAIVLEIAEETGTSYDASFSAVSKGLLHIAKGEAEEAIGWLSGAFNRSKDAGLEVLCAFSAAPLIRAYANADNFVAARNTAKTALAIAEQRNIDAFRAWLMAAQIEMLCLEGRFDRLDETLAQVMPLCEKNGYKGFRAQIVADVTLAHARAGGEEAKRFTGEAVKQVLQLPRI
ncbi:adenylate/guanylate cyclase domain-containing protein [Hoeflea sp. CAU 1731]